MAVAEESYRRYLSGDDSALSDIVELYNKGLILFVYGIVGNIYNAEDIASDTFLDLILKKPVFKGESSFKTWLYKIARNKAIDFFRKNKNQIQSTDDDVAESAVANETAEEELLSSERDRQLYKSMLSLPSDYRQVLELIYFANNSYSEAAEVMRKNTKQINNLAYRAKLALREALLKEGFIYEDN